MRLVREVFHSDFKITIFSWNNRYLIKLEQGPFEQTYKIAETDLTDESDLTTLLDAEFLHQAAVRFSEMGQSFHEAMKRASL